MDKRQSYQQSGFSYLCVDPLLLSRDNCQITALVLSNPKEVSVYLTNCIQVVPQVLQYFLVRRQLKRSWRLAGKSTGLYNFITIISMPAQPAGKMTAFLDCQQNGNLTSLLLFSTDSTRRLIASYLEKALGHCRAIPHKTKTASLPHPRPTVIIKLVICTSVAPMAPTSQALHKQSKSCALPTGIGRSRLCTDLGIYFCLTLRKLI